MCSFTICETEYSLISKCMPRRYGLVRGDNSKPVTGDKKKVLTSTKGHFSIQQMTLFRIDLRFFKLIWLVLKAICSN